MNTKHLTTNNPNSESAQDERRWQHLKQPNTGNDEAFVYAVITTGIYCRLGCPSRLPNRDNVRFFNNANDAKAAGFRACKRCRPEATSADATQTERITRLCHYIETAEQEPSLQELANYAGISVYHLQRQFKAITGISPKTYAKAHRQQINFPSRNTKPGAKLIQFACGNSSLGNFLVARSEKGICAILLGDTHEELLTDLRKRFPTSELHQNNQEFIGQLHTLVQLIEHPQQALKLPLDIRGTLFQQQVWKALQEIPVGETRSYSEIAQAIGSPKAVRAVASACAANSIAIAIPCHRVVRHDGNLSGYRWGTARKKILLQREMDSDN